jgi:hypothetical protein
VAKTRINVRVDPALWAGVHAAVEAGVAKDATALLEQAVREKLTRVRGSRAAGIRRAMEVNGRG